MKLKKESLLRKKSWSSSLIVCGLIFMGFLSITSCNKIDVIKKEKRKTQQKDSTIIFKDSSWTTQDPNGNEICWNISTALEAEVDEKWFGYRFPANTDNLMPIRVMGSNGCALEYSEIGRELVIDSTGNTRHIYIYCGVLYKGCICTAALTNTNGNISFRSNSAQQDYTVHLMLHDKEVQKFTVFY